MWQIVTNQVPRDSVNNDDIELHVRGGTRVPQLEVDETDRILLLLSNLVESML